MRYLFTLFLIGQVFLLQAQTNDILFWESSASFNYKITDEVSLNSGISQRTLFLESEPNNQFENLFYDLNQFATIKINSKVKVSGGYKYRFATLFNANSSYEHRLAQQVSIRHIQSALRLVSRFRTEQRFRNDSRFTHRYRYRLSADFPLSGASLDINEFYVVLSSEFLLSAEKQKTSILDNRLNASLGYVLNQFIKLQLSYVQRLENFNNDTDKRSFISTDVYFSLR